MKKYLILGALAAGLLAPAKSLSPEQALSRVTESNGPARMAAQQDLRLVYTAEAGAQPCAYVFQSAQNGFVVAAADDLAPAVLGYSDQGTFVLNDNVRYWLEEYGRQIEWANRHGAEPMQAPQHAERASVAPWLTTKWNQDEPFNLLCPIYDHHRSVTGCVATAIAQVMNFHQWPDKGVGSNSYTAQAINQTVTFDFASTTFDWANMLDTYPNSGNDATQAQRNAVATLMKACGVSCNMNYSPSASGAFSRDAGIGLIKYLKYDRGIEYMERKYYSPTQWEDIVYEQITQGPLYYSGANSEAGHAFVIDGYSSGGYFHLNWGWGGTSDGYFLLTALDPSSQGIGGSNAGYNFGQEILCNVKPQGATPGNYVYNVVTGGNDFTITTQSCKRGDRVKIGTPVYNNSLGTMDKMCIGLMFTSSTGQQRFVQGILAENVGPFYGFTETEAYLPTDLAAGTYTVTYVWAANGENTVHPVLVPYAQRQSYTATVTGNTVTFTPDDYLDVTLSDVEISPLYVDQMYKVSAKVTNANDREFSDVTYAFLVRNGQVVYTGDQAMLDVPANSTIDFTYFDTFSNVEAGNYEFWLATIHEGYLHALVWQEVEVKASNQNPSLAFGPVVLLNEDKNAVPNNDVRLQATVTNSGGYFAGTIDLWLIAYDENNKNISSQCLKSKPLFLEDGQTATAEFTGRISNIYTGVSCSAQIYYDKWINNPIWFTLLAVDEPSPTVRPVVTIGALTIGDGENPIDPAQFTAVAPISVAKADYAGEAYLVIKTQMNITAYTFDPIEVTVAADETSEIRFAADLSGVLKNNTIYNAQLYVNDKVTGDKVKFKTMEADGVSAVEGDPEDYTYYNLQGIPVANPGPGTYILVTPQGTTKVRIQ
ncbi:MAG: C10 family peptidase [Muribaculaceae bacterium]|nr:C10 family peptidase [Muribaculaceae bacterium]